MSNVREHVTLSTIMQKEDHDVLTKALRMTILASSSMFLGQGIQ